jgi:hypothetical protein
MTTANPPAAEARIAGAPISWGVCEVPGWGYQLGPDRVLAEMRQVGLAAVGGFTPLLLHVAAHDPVPEVDRLLDAYEASGAGVLVLSAVTGAEGYDTRPELDDDGWSSTPGTCSSAAPTRPSWPARRPSGSPTSISRTSAPASPGGSRTAG